MAPRFAGRVQSGEAMVKFPAVDLELDHLSVDLPFEWQKNPDSGRAEKLLKGKVSIGDIRKGTTIVRDLHFPILFKGGHYQLAGKIQPLEFLGGSVELQDLDIGLTQDPGRIQLSLGMVDVDFQEVTRMGLGPERISDLARLIREAIHAHDSEAVRRRVRDFTADLKIVHFCESQDRRQEESRG